MQVEPIVRNISMERIERGVNASIDLNCIATKCVPCAAKAVSGDISGAISCALTNCPQCIF